MDNSREGEMVRQRRRRSLPRVAGMVATLLVVLIVAACGAGGTSISQTKATATATATPDASGQDTLPTPATPTAPTATPAHPPVTGSKPIQAGVPAPPSDVGYVILVSLSRQEIYAYKDGIFVFSNPVETGRPELPTPTGVYHVYNKQCSDLRWTSNSAPTSYHNANCPEHNGDGYQEVFNSPWQSGSPYWYAPTHINYALEFLEGGYYLHDAWWHVAFGPGSNVPHQLPDGTWETGSHGCVGMTTASASRLYAWAPIGTTVYVRANV